MSRGRPTDDNIPENDPLMGTIQSEGFVSETPPDVGEFLAEAGLVGKAYVCTIKRAPQGGSGAKEFLPGSEKGSYPPIEDIGKRFGPGRFYYCFAWRTRDPETNKQTTIYKEYPIYLGSEWNDIHDDYMAERWSRREKEIEQTAQRNRLHKAAKGILPDDKEEKEDPLENLRKTAGTLKDLGVPIGGRGNSEGGGDSLALMGVMMQLQQKASESQMQMFTQMNNNMMQMMALMFKSNQPQSTNDIFKEVLNMVTGAVNLKEALNPEKQGVVDKIFGLAESVMPAIMEIAKKPPHVRAQDPLVGMVKGSGDFSKIKNDPEMLKAMTEKWDKAHGKEQTDIILDTLGMKRPGTGNGEAKSTETFEGEFSDVMPDPETGEGTGEGEGSEDPEEDGEEN